MSNWKTLALTTSLTLGFALGACSGKKEADAMGKLTDEMCACKDVACVDKVFEEAEKLSNANAGKEVNADQADRYNNDMARAQKCYEKIHQAAEDAEAKQPPK